MMQNDTYKVSTTIMAISACFLWSTAFAAIKVGQMEYPYPFSFAGMRFIIAGVMLVPFWKGIRRHIPSIAANFPKILVLAVVNTFLHYGLFYISIFHLPAALTAIIIGSSPLITALFAMLFVRSEKIGMLKLLAIMMGMAGITYISLQRGAVTHDSIHPGYIILLFGAVSCGVTGSFIVAKLKEVQPLDPVVLTSLQIFIGGIMLFVVSLFTEGAPQLSGKTWKLYSALGWLSFISAAGFSVWFIILKRPEVLVTDVNRWKFIIPLFGAIISWGFVEGESPTFAILTGMGVVVLSVIWYEWLNTRKHVPPLT